MKINQYHTWSRSMPIALLFIFLVSCQQFLEPDPPSGTITEDIALETFEDITAALNGVYRSGVYNYFLISFNEWRGDNLVRGKDNGGIGTPFYNFTYTSSNTAENTGLYRVAYNMILRANKILENIDQVEGGSTEERNDVIAQCLAVRALAHFDLLRLYADDYEATGDASHAGIAYLGSSIDVNEEPARLSVAESYQRILADLDEAITLFSTDAISDPTYLSKPATMAIRQRAYLYMKDFDKVIDEGTAVITTSGLLPEPSSSYPDMFNANEITGEFLFRIGWEANRNMDADGNGTVENMGDSYSFGLSVNNYAPNAEFMDQFAANDIRKSVCFSFEPDYIGEDKYFISKFRGAFNSGTTDQPVIRISEVYLSRAEAYYEEGQEDLARVDLDFVRAARIPGYTSLGETGTALRDAIRLERRKELAYEGHRFSDLRRWNQDVDRGSSCNDAGTGLCNFTITDSRRLLPIPQHEMDANSNMIQNEGY